LIRVRADVTARRRPCDAASERTAFIPACRAIVKAVSDAAGSDGERFCDTVGISYNRPPAQATGP
jgi:hypothetical protein